MPFDPLANRTPTSIPSIIVILRCLKSVDDEGNPVSTRSADYQLYVNDQNGEHLLRREGDLMPHLTTQEKSQLQAILNRLRTLAEAALPQA